MRTKHKEKTLKIGVRGAIFYLERHRDDFLIAMLKSRRQWNESVTQKDSDCQPRILYLAKISLRSQGEKVTFSGKRKLRKFLANRLTIF